MVNFQVECHITTDGGRGRRGEDRQTHQTDATRPPTTCGGSVLAMIYYPSGKRSLNRYSKLSYACQFTDRYNFNPVVNRSDYV